MILMVGMLILAIAYPPMSTWLPSVMH